MRRKRKSVGKRSAKVDEKKYDRLEDEVK